MSDTKRKLLAFEIGNEDEDGDCHKTDVQVWEIARAKERGKQILGISIDGYGSGFQSPDHNTILELSIGTNGKPEVAVYDDYGKRARTISLAAAEMPGVLPGYGWRLLKPDETIQKGDQFKLKYRRSDAWDDCTSSVGSTPDRFNGSSMTKAWVRRKLVPPKVPAGYRLLGGDEEIIVGDMLLDINENNVYRMPAVWCIRHSAVGSTPSRFSSNGAYLPAWVCRPVTKKAGTDSKWRHAVPDDVAVPLKSARFSQPIGKACEQQTVVGNLIGFGIDVNRNKYFICDTMVDVRFTTCEVMVEDAGSAT